MSMVQIVDGILILTFSSKNEWIKKDKFKNTFGDGDGPIYFFQIYVCFIQRSSVINREIVKRSNFTKNETLRFGINFLIK